MLIRTFCLQYPLHSMDKCCSPSTLHKNFVKICISQKKMLHSMAGVQALHLHHMLNTALDLHCILALRQLSKCWLGTDLTPGLQTSAKRSHLHRSGKVIFSSIVCFTCLGFIVALITMVLLMKQSWVFARVIYQYFHTGTVILL